jgi:hypothetical protein
MEMAAARIAAARAENPRLFHPLGQSVVESVHRRIANGTTRRDAVTALDHLDLSVDHVLDRARRTHAARTTPEAIGLRPLEPPEPIAARQNGHSNGHERPVVDSPSFR